jgi:tetratricopeptide (TPR) repeat protein
MTLTAGHDVRDWLCLAMCQWQLGQKDRARRILRQAMQWIPGGGEDRTEYLAEFRQEAVALIGKPDTTPTVLLTRAPSDPSAYTLVLEIEPKTAWAYAYRGVACGYLKQWDQATADFTRATEIRPDYYVWWYALAAARLGAGDTPGYCRARTEIMRRFGGTKAPGVAGYLCYHCAVVPVEPNEADALLRLAEIAVSVTPVNPRIRGAVNYRAGKYEAAVADLSQSAPVSRRAPDWLFLAMAHHQLGHADEAKKDLQEAVRWIEQLNRTGGTAPAALWIAGWYAPVEVEYLLREARALIR